MISCLAVFIISLTILKVSATSVQDRDASSVSKAMGTYDVPAHTQNLTLDGPFNVGWVVCNIPPRYGIVVTIRDCGVLYHRHAGQPGFERRRAIQAIATPWTLGEKGDICVIRLENYDRRQHDVFSVFDIFAAVFRALGQCSQGYGGAASIGLRSFYVSVAGAIPPRRSIAQDQNATLSLPWVPFVKTSQSPDTA